jgi:type I restriction enzyme S subunit
MIHGVGRPRLNLSEIKSIALPLPPFEEQSEIAREVDRRLSASDRFAAALDQQTARTRATRQSVLCEAFAGLLVPQNPNAEPASVLLEGIRAAREAESQKPKVKRMPKSKLTVTRRPLLDVLRENKGPMEPEQLFSKAGFKASQVDLFYRELASLHDKLQVEKPQASEAKAWPYNAHFTLQLKESGV